MINISQKNINHSPLEKTPRHNHGFLQFARYLFIHDQKKNEKSAHNQINSCCWGFLVMLNNNIEYLFDN